MCTWHSCRHNCRHNNTHARMRAWMDATAWATDAALGALRPRTHTCLPLPSPPRSSSFSPQESPRGGPLLTIASSPAVLSTSSSVTKNRGQKWAYRRENPLGLSGLALYSRSSICWNGRARERERADDEQWMQQHCEITLATTGFIDHLSHSPCASDSSPSTP